MNRRNISVPILSQIKDQSRKNEQNFQDSALFKKIKSKNNRFTTSFHQLKKPQKSTDNFKLQKLGSKTVHLESNTKKKLINFAKNQNFNESYVKQFKLLNRNSFLLNNRLTKSVFDISDAAMMGKPQAFNTFRSATENYQAIIPSLKDAVRNFKKNQVRKEKKSYIPHRYQRSLSLLNLNHEKSPDLNISHEKQFFPTNALQKTRNAIKCSLQKNEDVKNQDSLTNRKFKLLRRPKQQLSERAITPFSSKKIVKIDHRISELKVHNESMQKLIPIPKKKPEILTVKGKGQMVSHDKIARVIDKLLSILQLYFQMYDEDGSRVMSFIKNIEGFQNPGIKLVLCKNSQIKHIKSSEQIKEHFWIFKKLNVNEKNVELPEFFGQEDYALYKTLNSFALKLESKYENNHKQKFKKIRENDFLRQSKQLTRLQKIVNQGSKNNKNSSKNQPKQQISNQNNYKSLLTINSLKKPFKDSLKQKLKYNAISNDQKMSSQIQDLEYLGVKFDFKQKSRNLILSQRSKAFMDKK